MKLFGFSLIIYMGEKFIITTLFYIHSREILSYLLTKLLEQGQNSSYYEMLN